MIEKIFPVFCGEFNAKKKVFEDFFSTGGLPAAPSVAVESVERGSHILNTIQHEIIKVWCILTYLIFLIIFGYFFVSSSFIDICPLLLYTFLIAYYHFYMLTYVGLYLLWFYLNPLSLHNFFISFTYLLLSSLLCHSLSTCPFLHHQYPTVPLFSPTLVFSSTLFSSLFCSPLFSCFSLSCLVLSSLPFLFLAVYSRISFSPLFLFFQQVHLLLSSLPFYLSIHQSFPLICSILYFYSPLLLSSIVYLPVQHLSYSLLLSYLFFPFCLLLFTCLLFFLFLILFLIYLSSFLCTSIYFLYQFTYLLPCVLLYQFTYFISSPLFFSINSTVYYLHQLT